MCKMESKGVGLRNAESVNQILFEPDGGKMENNRCKQNLLVGEYNDLKIRGTQIFSSKKFHTLDGENQGKCKRRLHRNSSHSIKNGTRRGGGRHPSFTVQKSHPLTEACPCDMNIFHCLLRRIL